MSHPTDWDIDSYRTSHESEEHWELRRRFMERWKDNFPEDRLVCLARVFTNIEFLGCRYPAEVMKLVAELSKEVAYEYRESRKTKVRRTFVSASDAAGDKAKGIKRSANEHNTSEPPTKKIFVSAQESNPGTSTNKSDNKDQTTNKKFDYTSRFQKASNDSSLNEQSTDQYDIIPSQPSFLQNRESYSRKTSFIQGQEFNPARDRGNNSQFSGWNRNSSQHSSFEQRFNKQGNNNRCANPRIQNNADSRYQDDSRIINSEYGQLVLFDSGGTYYTKLFSSCQRCKVTMDAEHKQEKTEWRCCIRVNNVVVSSVCSFSQKEAKEAASKMAWEKLQNKLYTLVVKQRHSSKDDSVISVQDVSTDTKTKDNLIDGLDTKVDSAIATRMMQMMGWKGGALGSAGDGISEPIQPNLKQIRRAGLGSEVGDGEASIRDAVKRTIREFAHNGDADYDLVFASDFTKDERAIMHKLAQSMNLKSKSYGKDENRYIVISKPISVVQLVKKLLENGGSNQKYDLIHPVGR